MFTSLWTRLVSKRINQKRDANSYRRFIVRTAVWVSKWRTVGLSQSTSKSIWSRIFHNKKCKHCVCYFPLTSRSAVNRKKSCAHNKTSQHASWFVKLLLFCEGGGRGEGGEKFKLAIDQSKISFIDNARNEDNHADEVGERALEMYFEVSESRFLQPLQSN